MLVSCRWIKQEFESGGSLPTFASRLEAVEYMQVALVWRCIHVDPGAD